MLWTILVILLVLWLLGFLGHVGGGMIHLLLVIAAIVLVINLCLAGARFRRTWSCPTDHLGGTVDRATGPRSAKLGVGVSDNVRDETYSDDSARHTKHSDICASFCAAQIQDAVFARANSGWPAGNFAREHSLSHPQEQW